MAPYMLYNSEWPFNPPEIGAGFASLRRNLKPQLSRNVVLCVNINLLPRRSINNLNARPKRWINKYRGQYRNSANYIQKPT
jgi:hypothetical protein